MKKLVLILVGLPGSGKTMASSFLKTKKIPIVRMGDVTDEALKRENLPKTPENERMVREALRRDKGEDIYAKKIAPQILSLLKTNSLVVVDGMRNKEEYKFFKKSLPEIKIVFIESSEKIRHQRLTGRKERSLTEEQAKKRDMSELSRLGLYTFRRSADYIIQNESTKLEFYKKLNEVLREIKL